MKAEALRGGFADPVFASQAVFRALLGVLSQPGTVARIAPVVSPPAPLNAAAAAVIAALADEDTPVFLDAPLAAAPAIRDWITFHAGARIVDAPADAVFAAIADPGTMPALSAFAQGTDAYPDRSATLIVQVTSLSAGKAIRLEGPGIAASATIRPDPMPAALVAGLQANRQRFPRGVDLVLAAPDAIAGLPRTTRISAGDD